MMRLCGLVIGLAALAWPAQGQTICADSRVQGVVAPPPAAKHRDCGIRQPVKVSAIAGVAITPPALMDCALAQKLADWLEGDAQARVHEASGSVLTQISNAAGYVCRPRNNQPGARISAHGQGMALDLSAIRLSDGQSLSVLRDWGHPALSALAKSACGPLSTVLHPSSDRYHRDHIHLDALARREPYCP